jgi:hypothetical protein
MVQLGYKTFSVSITRKDLVESAKKFLLHSEPDQDRILVDNIHSAQFGSSDLLFLNKAKTNVTVARLHDEGERERFVMASISYYFWLNEFIRASEVFFNRKSGLDMYLFSDDFSAPICYMIDNIQKKLKIYLVQYHFFKVEDLHEPVIYFQHITPKDMTPEKPEKKERQDSFIPPKISPEELNEFNRLEEFYLG